MYMAVMARFRAGSIFTRHSDFAICPPHSVSTDMKLA